MSRFVRLAALAALFLLSGAAALGYQLVWLRWFGLLLGNTTQAAATVLAVFFGGLGLGYALLGRVADRTPRPLAWYAALEAAAALFALAVRPLLTALESVYPTLATLTSGHAVATTLSRVGLAAVALLPCAIALGGTLPVLGRTGVLLDRPGERFLRPAALLYGANTLGAVAGTWLAGIWLPPLIGVQGTMYAAVAVGLGVALLAWGLSTQLSVAARSDSTASSSPDDRGADSLDGAAESGAAAVDTTWYPLIAVVVASGFCTLAAEVAFTRIFALTFHNSVYTYSLVAGVCIFALAFGSFAVAGLDRFVSRRPRALLWTAVLAGAAVVAAGWLFAWRTGFDAWAIKAGWPGYMWACLGLVASILLLPFVIAGGVLPLSWKLLERQRPGRAGAVIGTLTAWNTLGAITGSLFAGFVAVPWLGLFGTLALIACVYAAVVFGVAGSRLFGAHRRPWPLRVAALVVATAAVAVAATTPPPQYVGKQERLIALHEGASGTVAVVKTRLGDLALKIDNFYNLGQSSHAILERRLGHLPLLMHPNPTSVAVIGLATGITASATLAHTSVKRVTVAELVPEVVAAEAHFQPYNGKVLDDPRVDLVVGDGRNHIAYGGGRYDVVIGDLFVPWQAGAAALYSVDHFRNVRRTLGDEGLFCQWLPIYQLASEDLDAIAASFFEVFPDGEVWQLGLGFMMHRPVIGLVGRAGGKRASLRSMARRIATLKSGAPAVDPYLDHVATMLLLFAGRPRAGAFDDVALNTDDRPILEYSSPIAQAERRAAVLDKLVAWMDKRLQPWATDAERYEQKIRTGLLDITLSAARGDRSGAVRMLQLVHGHRTHPFIQAINAAAQRGEGADGKRAFFTDLQYFAGLVPVVPGSPVERAPTRPSAGSAGKLQPAPKSAMP
ncbi:MAG: fused MFS/spermidine synthase [Myxococcales bacterium]|nr:fused MFS/spermidine synthase [Myxococcales bacterium]